MFLEVLVPAWMTWIPEVLVRFISLAGIGQKFVKCFVGIVAKRLHTHVNPVSGRM